MKITHLQDILASKITTIILVMIVIITIFLRAYHPISRPNQWHSRSGEFSEALSEGDWEGTYLSRHPGVTVMGIGALSLFVYDAVLDTPGEILFSWTVPPYATPYGRESAAIVLGIALIIAALSILIIYSLDKLGGRYFAIAGIGLISFSPIFLANNRIVHVDSLLSLFMILSMLLLLVSMKTKQKRYFYLSAFVGGLAVLSRVTAVFMIPFVGLTLLVYIAEEALRVLPSKLKKEKYRWLFVALLKDGLLPLLGWVIVALIPFVFWPALWANSPEILFEKTALLAGEHIVTPHPNSGFFMGKISVDEQPPLMFYPVVFLLKSSATTAVLALIALGHYSIWRKRGKHPLQPIQFWLIVAFILLFILQMSIGAKQIARYILPAQIGFDLLAAIGCISLVNLIKGALETQRCDWLPRVMPIVLALSVGGQIVFAVSNMPDYGMHHNYLFGGNRVAVNSIEILQDGEGSGAAARYLQNKYEGKPLPRLFVTNPLKKVFRHVYDGEVGENLGAAKIAETDYYVIGYGHVQRQRVSEEWVKVIEEAEVNNTKPEFIVSFDGLPLYWIYPVGRVAEKTEVVRRGGVGFIVFAWTWTFVIGAMLRFALVQPLSLDREEQRLER